MISGNKRGLTPTMKRELKRRSAIEPMIGHAKNDGSSAETTSSAPTAIRSTRSSPRPGTTSVSSSRVWRVFWSDSSALSRVS